MQGPETFIIEDDELFTLLHAAQVKKSGLSETPRCYRNGLEAIRAMEQHPEKHYLLLLDINMPLMNGWELLDHIQAADYKHRVLVAIVSSSINESDQRKAYSYPQVISFIQKPFRQEDCHKLMAQPQLAPFYEQEN